MADADRRPGLLARLVSRLAPDGGEAGSAPARVPLGPPGPGGRGWPDAPGLGRPTFASAAHHETAQREAFEPEAHAVADRLVDELLARRPLVADPEDAPHLRKTLLWAARSGAGVALVERRLGPVDPESVDRDVAAALWRARRALPGMPEPWAGTAASLLLAGFHLARSGPDALPALLDRLDAEPDSPA